MSASNGYDEELATVLSRDQIQRLSDEERKDYWDKLKEMTKDDAAASGYCIPGEDPFEKEFQIDFDWPKTAGRQVGDEWVEDSWQAKVQEATLVVGRPYKEKARAGRVRASTLKRIRFTGENVQQMREAVSWNQIKEWNGTPDPFAYGSESALQGIGGALGQYVPLWPGPVTRQLYWGDYWMMSAKSFEAYNHDPISWRIIHLKQEFCLGKGLVCHIHFSSGTKKGQTHDKAQAVWDDFWKRNKMEQRLDTISRDFCWGGEQFLRYFRGAGANRSKLVIRSLDPASIYDLITDPEDIETVFAYHQQFQTAYQLYAPGTANPPGMPPAPTGGSTPGSVVKYIIRQILPQEIDHYKTNASGFERRGRSDLFPALGWIKRLRDYLTSAVIRSDMLSRIGWDLQVAGNQTTVQTLMNQLFPGGRAPQPGTVFGHNNASKLEVVGASGIGGPASGRTDPILDALVTMTCLAGGIPKDWLGFGSQNTRAGALVATEPAAKTLDALQGTLGLICYDGFVRAMNAAGIVDAEMEITFPAIAAEDRKGKLDDLGTMEANSWISKQTAASLGAKEMQIDTFDYGVEQKLIAGEFPKAETTDSDSGLLGPDGKPFQKPKQGDGKVRAPVIMASKRQARKLDVTKSPSMEDEPPGLLVPTDGSDPPAPGKSAPDPIPAPGSVDGTGRTVPGGGSHHDSENPSSPQGAANIRKDHTQLRQSAPIYTQEDVELLVAAAMREGARVARRRPDDPEYERLSKEYRGEARGNLDDLLGDARSASKQGS